MPWPQRVIDQLGGREPRPGDVYMECCVQDVCVVDEDFISRHLESIEIDGSDSDGRWWRTIDACIAAVRANHAIYMEDLGDVEAEIAILLRRLKSGVTLP